jgi:peptidoglycan/LPS O-acetylase OafA/YrhL
MTIHIGGSRLGRLLQAGGRSHGTLLTPIDTTNLPDVGSRTTFFEHVPTLDGWRALSVLAVIYFHCIQNGLTQGSIWYRLATRGYLGVDVFFAISGFLICGKLLDGLRQTGHISLKQFYIRRVFRILPPVCTYLAVLAIVTSFGWTRSKPWEFWSTLLFVRNYFPIMHGQQEIGVFTSQFWSLAVEEHFYLFWPVAMLLLGPRVRRIGWSALAVALAVFLWRTVDAKYGWLTPFGTSVLSKTDTRIDALLWGCLAAILYPYVVSHFSKFVLRNMWIPVCLLAALMALVHYLPGSDLARAVLFPAMIMSTAISSGSLLGRFLEFPLVRWIGRVSYSVYIWQQLAILPVSAPGSPLRWLQHFPYNIAVIFIAASISYYLIERPMVRLGHKLAPHHRSNSAAGAIIPA